MVWRRRSEPPEVERTEMLAAARSLYEQRPFIEVTMADIARTAGTTSVALEQEFGSVADLYAELFALVHAEIGAQLGARLTSDDPVQMMRDGIAAFLELFSQPANLMVCLVNAPVALGHERWRAVGDVYGSMLMDAAVSHAMDRGVLREQPVRPLATVMVGMLEAAALWIPGQPDRERALAECNRVLNEILDGMVQRSGSAPDHVQDD